LEELLSGDFLHAPTSAITYAMNTVKSQVAVISERTGAITHMNPTRFRYTLGTNLAREGKGEYVIAEALDHSDTQNASVYVRNIPEFVEQIDKAVALQLAPLAQAFRGVLVVNEAAAHRGGDPTSRIYSSGGNVGSCGSFGFCGALAPVACYTCAHFQPWLEGPHELVLDQLISERDSVLQATGDPKVASVNDRLILAVSDVVTRCNAMKSEPVHV
ncbi:DNA breaking-rejoining enzyme, partial [Stutzerimonas stutzeri KOS6]